eukprot:4805942-Alexandrium_andersonii.AAC.1
MLTRLVQWFTDPLKGALTRSFDDNILPIALGGMSRLMFGASREAVPAITAVPLLLPRRRMCDQCLLCEGRSLG